MMKKCICRCGGGSASFRISLAHQSMNLSENHSYLPIGHRHRRVQLYPAMIHPAFHSMIEQYWHMCFPDATFKTVCLTAGQVTGINAAKGQTNSYDITVQRSCISALEQLCNGSLLLNGRLRLEFSALFSTGWSIGCKRLHQPVS